MIVLYYSHILLVSYNVSIYEFSLVFFFFKQKTAYEMRISDWSSDVCSSDLLPPGARQAGGPDLGGGGSARIHRRVDLPRGGRALHRALRNGAQPDRKSVV